MGRGGELNDWIIDVNKRAMEMKDTSAPELERWKNRSIYKLPNHVVEGDDKSYMPHVVSLGPYHHGNQSLQPVEEQKQRALIRFLKKSEKALELYVDALEKEVEHLKEAYDQLDSYWQTDTDAFLKLMILDGCFILEIIHLENDGGSDDPIFSTHGILNIQPFIKLDMLLVENQVPLLVLEILMDVANPKIKAKDLILKLILRFYILPKSENYVRACSTCLHVLDVYRKGLTCEVIGPRRRFRYPMNDDINSIIPSATSLHGAGIRFKRSPTISLKDISFRNGTLKFPLTVIDGFTRTVLSNLMAFERTHAGAGYEVNSYVYFLSCLIHNREDVSLLESYGIIMNALGTGEDVVNLFVSISKYVCPNPDDSMLEDVHREVSRQLNRRVRRRLNEWRIDLFTTYFKTPWGVLSVVAAIILFTLTAIQTVYSVLSYIHR